MFSYLQKKIANLSLRGIYDFVTSYVCSSDIKQVIVLCQLIVTLIRSVVDQFYVQYSAVLILKTCADAPHKVV